MQKSKSKSSDNEHKYNHTLSKRPSLAQIASYIVFTTETIIFYVLVIDMYQSDNIKITMISLFTVSLVAMILITIYTGFTDPSDTLMIQYKQGNTEIVVKYRQQNPQKMLFCQYCQSYVKEESRHCRVCDTCTQNFDHHCQWINTCIGQKNYTQFFIMIVVTWSNLSIYLIAMILATIDKAQFIEIHYLIVGWIIGFIVLVFWFLIFNLILLHIYLWFRGMTTYQFIMIQRQQQRLEKLKEEEEKYRQKQIQFENRRKENLQKKQTKKIEVSQRINKNQSIQDTKITKDKITGTEKTLNLQSNKRISTQERSQLRLNEPHSRQDLQDKKQKSSNLRFVGAKIIPNIDEDQYQFKVPQSGNSKQIYKTSYNDNRQSMHQTKNHSYANSSVGNHNKKTQIPTRKDNVFGQKEATQKSEGAFDDQDDNGIQMSSTKSKQQKGHNRKISKHSLRKSSIGGQTKLSQFFVKNNSFRLMIGKNDYTQPIQDNQRTKKLDDQIKRSNKSYAQGLNNLSLNYEIQNTANYRSTVIPTDSMMKKNANKPKQKLKKIVGSQK